MFPQTKRLDLARRLAADGNEAAHRAAIHAAYYAVFHLCADHLGWDAGKKGQARHTDVQEAMVREPNGEPWVRLVKRSYATLLRLRVQADYDNAAAISKDNASHAASMARAIFEAR